MKLTIDAMKALIKYAESIGVTSYNVVQLNDPFIYLEVPPTSKFDKKVNVLVSHAVVRTKIQADPIEEVLWPEQSQADKGECGE